ncbi:MAG: hypothetical protein HFJ46_06620 [Clostridia bacterium]|nr:hypothetical protein [Clostridia bacterium]
MKKVTKKVISVVVVLLILLVAAGVYAYVGTDLLKSDKQLFYKYMGKNLDTITDMNLAPYRKMDTKDKTYKMSGEFSSEALKEITGEDKEIRLKFEVLSDSKNKKASGNYKILLGGKDFLGIDYINNNDRYGIKVDEITDEKYIVVENNNLKELAKRFGIEDVSEIPDKIDTELLENDKKIDEKKLEKIKDKYTKLIDDKISDDKYTKEEVELNIKDEILKTKKYSLTLTEKELYDIAYEFLNTLKDDTDTIEFFLSLIYEDEIDVTVEDVKEKIAQNIEELEDSKNEIDEENSLVISVYNSKGKTVRTELVTSAENKIMYTATKNNDIDELKLEAFEGEENILSAVLTNTVNSDGAEILVKIVSEKEDTDLEIKYSFTNITDKSVDMNFVGKLNSQEIIKFVGKVETNVKSDIEDITEDNSIILNSCSEEEFNNTISNISQKASTVVLGKIYEVAPELLTGSTPNTSTELPSNSVNELEGKVNEEVTEEVNKALKACQDDYIAAYTSNQNIDISEYLNETEVLKKCPNAKEVVFTETGVRYVAKDGTTYEGDVDYNAIATGYVTIAGMIEK